MVSGGIFPPPNADEQARGRGEGAPGQTGQTDVQDQLHRKFPRDRQEGSGSGCRGGEEWKAAGGPAKGTGRQGQATDKESLYAAAYELFREGKYEKSREAFETFLKQYPETEFSDNAQFWIGECYYFEKKYEKAIIEYDKVVKNFPEGSKVPYALLKQGLSFLQLGDKASAKLLLQQVIKDYPNTSQARIARTRLAEIK